MVENNDKILKIFSSIRCLNRDQLPRYLDGRLTELEKHLVEQHLVDCDLCFDALQALQQPAKRAKYQPMSVSIQQYIRNSIKQVSHVQKAERYQRQEQKKESLLIYFWVVAAIAVGAGGVYMAQQQHRYRNSTASRSLAADLTQSPSAEVQAAVGRTVVANKDTLRSNTPLAATAPPPPVPVTAVAPPAPAPVKRDSAKIAPAKPAAPKKDSAVATTIATKPAPAPVAKPVETPAKETTVVNIATNDKTPAKAEPKPAVKKSDDEEDDKKSAPIESGTDEFMYKAAMVYHQQGDLNEAISRYKHLASSPGRYGELSRYQLAVCYRSKGQMGKARRTFKEVVKMNGAMKDKAQAALDSL